MSKIFKIEIYVDDHSWSEKTIHIEATDMKDCFLKICDKLDRYKFSKILVTDCGEKFDRYWEEEKLFAGLERWKIEEE